MTQPPSYSLREKIFTDKMISLGIRTREQNMKHGAISGEKGVVEAQHTAGQPGVVIGEDTIIQNPFRAGVVNPLRV